MLHRPASYRLFSCFLLLILLTPLVSAHPMGNFSVNHYARITIENGAIYIRYLIDMAEIPTYQEIQDTRIVARSGDPSLPAYLLEKGESLKRGITLSLDGKPLFMHQISRQIIFPPGAGGLPTMKMSFLYRADVQLNKENDADLKLLYTDSNYVGRAGWKEIVVSAPESVLLESSAPRTDRSRELTDYPTDLLTTPPQDLTAFARFKSSALTALHSPRVGMERAQNGSNVPAIPHQGTKDKGLMERIVPPVPPSRTPAEANETEKSEPLTSNKQVTPRSAFTELMTARNFSLWFLLTAAVIAAGLGALHALEPGHGKTIVAAYLVGTRGTARHAMLLGITVTVAHTLGVFALGVITLYGSHYIVPEHLYPWLGIISGLTIAGIGVFMILRRWSGEDGEHTHNSGKPHSDWFLSSRESVLERAAITRSAGLGTQPETASTAPVTLYQLLALGITGGIIPCPAALVVLLSAFSLHRIGFGLFLIVAFSIGLASVLIGVGMSMVYAKRFVSRLRMDSPLVTRWLPIASSAFMVILGFAISVRALATVNVGMHFLSKERLGPFLFVVGLGLFLGMRHSTDPDHVVAVSTFVSKEFTVRRAVVIGMMWGLGHTLTIFLVGSAIIIFGVAIPPRIGLSMEFFVAVMLILLGILNLTGSMRRINDRFSKSRPASMDTPAAQSTDSASRTTDGSLFSRTVGSFGWYQCLRPLAVGIVHGLAGSAAVALLVLSTIHSPVWATAYLLVFGAGTMVGMMLMTAIMVVPMAYSGRRFNNVSKYLTVCSGMVSVGFGAFLVYQIGFLQGLFSSAPQWIPH